MDFKDRWCNLFPDFESILMTQSLLLEDATPRSMRSISHSKTEIISLVSLHYHWNEEQIETVVAVVVASYVVSS